MKRYLITFIFFISVFSTYAITDTVKNTFGISTSMPKNVPLLKTGQNTTVAGSRFSSFPLTTASSFTLENSLGVLELSIAKAIKTGTLPAATPTIVLAVTYSILDATGKSLKIVTEDVTLSLDVSTSKAIYRTYWSKVNAHQITASVKTITGIPSSGWEQLELNASIITNSYNTLSATPNYNLRHSTTLKDGNLNIIWDGINGAERYELEWTYIAGRNATSDDDTTIIAPDKLYINGSIFINNSSRVVLKNTSFDIPLVYEKGYILYRIRAVSKKYFGTSLEEYRSSWSNGEIISNTVLNNWSFGSNPNYYLYNGLENLKNWQSSISFAEEGKTKTVVTYHDGSMRNRQAVTRINSDDRAIVGETMYDYAGRPVIQMLPVPTNKASIAYFPNFNIISTSRNYIKKNDYVLTSPNGTCSPLAPKFSTDSGASNYYSPSNVFSNLNDGESHATSKIINRDLIPNAEQYPFTQTEYTLDNTGRINAQSAVGKNHILGGGHDTKYLYSTPTQDELTRLFGTQVGNASHYKKNIVIDANGQVSTSYLDLDGKVIATYLTGAAPENLKALDGINSTEHKDELLIGNKSNLLNADGTQKTMVYNVTVASNNTPYEFNYKADAQTIDVNCDQNNATTKKTFDGVLKVELTLTDKCKTNLINSKDTTKTGQTGVVQKLSLNPKITLNKGEYTLTKTLSVNERALDSLWTKYLADQSSNCLKTETNFVDEAAATLNLIADCEFTCASCNTMLGGLDHTDKEYELLKKLCKNVCGEDINPCSINLDALKADMSPGGQYGLIRSEQAMLPENSDPKLDDNGKVVTQKQQMTINTQNGSQDVDPSVFPLSVFNSNNVLPSQIKINNSEVRPSWKTPIRVIFDGTSDVLNNVMWESTLTNSSVLSYQETNYYNSDKSIAKAKIIKKVDGNKATYTPELDANGIAYFESNGASTKTEFMVPVKYLNKFIDFEKLWKPEWGAFLVPFHPEFKYYLNCMTNASIYAFEISLGRCSTLTQAFEKNYVIPTSTNDGYSSELLSKDPIKNAPESWVKNYMINKSIKYSKNESVTPNTSYTMIQMATSMARCPNGIDFQDACTALSSNCVDNKLVSDDDWLMYRNLYIGERQKILRRQADEKSAIGFYYNGCIGHSDYLQSPDADAFKRPFWRIETGTVQVRNCPWYKWWCGNTRTVTYSSPALKIPYLIGNQPCYQGTANLYAKKQQRFFPTTNASKENGSKVESNCGTENTYTYKDMTTGNDVTEIIFEPCSSDVAKTLQAGIQNVYRNKYEECGLCPIATDLQSFIVQLFDTKISNSSKNNVLLYQSTPIHVNCITSDIKVPVTLADIFKQTGQTTIPDITWKSTLSSDKKTLNGELVSGTKKFKVSLSLPTPTLANGLKSNINLDSILSICCLDIDRTIVGATNKFFLKANYIDIANPLDSLKTKVVYLNGTITLENLVVDIDNCSFPPQCAVSDKANSLVSFLNTLALQIGNSPSIIKQSHLLVASPITLCSQSATDADNTLLYINSLRQILPTPTDINSDIDSYTPTWSQTTVNNVVTGEINYLTNQKEIISVNFNNSGYTFDPNNFVEFTNLETDVSDPYNMKAQVKYKVVSNNIVSYQYAPITISASFTLSVCKAVSRPNNVVPK